MLEPPPPSGRLMLSLDMSQALDRLPRNHLPAGFELLNVPSSLAQFFLQWLDQATYHFDHRRLKCSIVTSQGVRQGCKASPMEWTVFLMVLLTRLDANLCTETAQSWIEKHLLTYADDLLAKWNFQTKEEVSKALHQVGIILDVLEQLGMKINLNKSVLLLRLSGRQSRSLKKRLLVRQAGKIGLCIPRANGQTTFMPVVPNHVYLGIKIGYQNFEQQTLAYRLHIGRIAFLRLRPWLTHRHAYPLQLRVQLWQTCIRSACLHGLQALNACTVTSWLTSGRSLVHIATTRMKQLKHCCKDSICQCPFGTCRTRGSNSMTASSKAGKVSHMGTFLDGLTLLHTMLSSCRYLIRLTNLTLQISNCAHIVISHANRSAN